MIVKQPNGLYAVWSRAEEDFVQLNATPEEIIKELAEAEERLISLRVHREIAALKAGHTTSRSFEELVEKARSSAGQDALNKMLDDEESAREFCGEEEPS